VRLPRASRSRLPAPIFAAAAVTLRVARPQGRFVIEENARTGEEPVGLPVVRY
jgi:hypothetical protein